MECYQEGLSNIPFKSEVDYLRKCHELGYGYCPHCGESIHNHLSFSNLEKTISSSRLYAVNTDRCVHGNHKELCACGK